MRSIFHIWFKLLSGVVGFCHLVIFHRTPPAFVFGGRYLLAFFFVGLLYWYKIFFFERRPGSGFPSSTAARRYMPIPAARMSSISSGAACHPKMSGGCCSGSIWSRRLAASSWRISASVPHVSDDWAPCGSRSARRCIRVARCHVLRRMASPLQGVVVANLDSHQSMTQHVQRDGRVTPRHVSPLMPAWGALSRSGERQETQYSIIISMRNTLIITIMIAQGMADLPYRYELHHHYSATCTGDG